MFQSKPILSQDIWRSDRDIVASTSRRDVALHYERARSIFRHSGLSQQDIENLTPKFWDFQFDCNGVIAARDMTAFIIVAIQVNLCIGTLCSFVKGRPDLQDLVDKLLNFDICGGFMLTEADHGLDARNLETTATLLPDGSYDLHTPHVGASKAMPLTTPYCGMPRIAIVFARLLVDGKSHGVKPFLVCLSDACGMRPGVTSRILPTRPGTKPLDHSLTAFNHVDLPFSALLGSSSEPENDRLDFLRQIWRVSAGTLSLSIMGISAIKVGTRVAAVYIERRTITAPDGPVPEETMSFSTQQRPIVEGWVQGKVLHAFARWTIGMCPNLSDATQHALATIFKATVMKASQILRSLTERSEPGAVIYWCDEAGQGRKVLSAVAQRLELYDEAMEELTGRMLREQFEILGLAMIQKLVPGLSVSINLDEDDSILPCPDDEQPSASECQPNNVAAGDAHVQAPNHETRWDDESCQTIRPTANTSVTWCTLRRKGQADPHGNSGRERIYRAMTRRASLKQRRARHHRENSPSPLATEVQVLHQHDDSEKALIRKRGNTLCNKAMNMGVDGYTTCILVFKNPVHDEWVSAGHIPEGQTIPSLDAIVAEHMGRRQEAGTDSPTIKVENSSPNITMGRERDYMNMIVHEGIGCAK
ncbi:hypothetical protein FOVSG1_006800 [Fusarium oxysporum f. sp. vasinfectum]